MHSQLFKSLFMFWPVWIIKALRSCYRIQELGTKQGEREVWVGRLRLQGGADKEWVIMERRLVWGYLPLGGSMGPRDCLGQHQAL